MYVDTYEHLIEVTHSFMCSEIFYVRNNLPVPCVHVGNYSLEVGGINLTTVQLTLRQLTTLFSPTTISAVLQCAGNRRSEMNRVKPVSGTKWTGGAIGNANWTGTNLRDILALAGFQRGNYSPDVLNTLHIQVIFLIIVTCLIGNFLDGILFTYF